MWLKERFGLQASFLPGTKVPGGMVVPQVLKYNPEAEGSVPPSQGHGGWGCGGCADPVNKPARASPVPVSESQN